jgi:hypothetical protein
VRPEGLGQFKKSTSSGLEPATFRLAALCLNHYATALNNTLTNKKVVFLTDIVFRNKYNADN